jgi:hypothetical protein
MQGSIVLQPSLTDDAHSRIHFTNWKKSLATASQGMCRTLDDCGAYSQVADDTDWATHPHNIIHTTGAQGVITTTVRPRPQFIKPTIYTATEKSTAVINLFKYRENQWKEWTAAGMALHQAMISSIGALNLATIERLSGHAGILSLTCRELLGHITVMFGVLHASDVFYIENVIKEELSSFSTFRDFISRNSLNYDILAKIPHPISDITKIQWLENSLQRCPQFDIPIGTWKSLNTSVAARSYDSLVRYLSDQYSSLPPDTPSRGGKAFGATDGSSSTAQGPDRKRKRNRGKGKGKGGDKNNKRQQQQQAPTALAATAPPATDAPDQFRTGWEDEPSAMAGQLHQWTSTASVSSNGSDPGAQRRVRTAAHRFYCAVHGHNTTHNGVTCRPMLDDPSTYTTQHLQAKKPSDCSNPAGNDNVQALRPRFH